MRVVFRSLGHWEQQHELDQWAGVDLLLRQQGAQGVESVPVVMARIAGICERLPRASAIASGMEGLPQ